MQNIRQRNNAKLVLLHHQKDIAFANAITLSSGEEFLTLTLEI